MKHSSTQKILSLLLIIVFSINQLAYGLAIAPGSSRPEVRDDMYALGQKLFAQKRGDGGLGLDAEPGNFFGDAPHLRDVKFVPADYNNIPKGWENNHIIHLHDLIKALKYFRDNEALIPQENLDIVEGYFEIAEEDGELPICRIEKIDDNKRVLVIHTKFVQMWDHIRTNDVWFEYTFPGGEKRTISLAWGIFYRIAKHEMTDKIKDNLQAKSLGHATNVKLVHEAPDFIDFSDNEEEANTIGGKYKIINDAMWLWFLGSYAFRNTTRYNNPKFERRLYWLSGPEAEHIGTEEFPNLFDNYDNRNFAFDLAQAVNYHFFSRPDVIVPETTVDPKLIEKYEARSKITSDPMYATGNDRSERALLMFAKKSSIFFGPKGFTNEEHRIYDPKVSESTRQRDRRDLIKRGYLEKTKVKGVYRLTNAGIFGAICMMFNAKHRNNLGEMKFYDLETKRLKRQFKENKALESLLKWTYWPVAKDELLEQGESCSVVYTRSGLKARVAFFMMLESAALTPGFKAYLIDMIESVGLYDDFDPYMSFEDVMFYALYSRGIDIGEADGTDIKEMDNPTAGTLTGSLGDLAPHDLVNALVGTAIEWSRLGLLRNAGEDIVKETKKDEETGETITCYWFHNYDNWIGTFDLIFERLARARAGKGRHSFANNQEEVAMAQVLIDRAGWRGVKADEEFVAELKKRLSRQIEHFGVQDYNVFGISNNYQFRGVLRIHASFERKFHIQAVSKHFDGNFSSYRYWRKNGEKRHIDTKVNDYEIKGDMTYNEFAQKAHEAAEKYAPVAKYRRIHSAASKVDKTPGSLNDVPENADVPVAGIAGDNGSDKNEWTGSNAIENGVSVNIREIPDETSQVGGTKLHIDLAIDGTNLEPIIVSTAYELAEALKAISANPKAMTFQVSNNEFLYINRRFADGSVEAGSVSIKDHGRLADLLRRVLGPERKAKTPAEQVTDKGINKETVLNLIRGIVFSGLAKENPDGFTEEQYFWSRQKMAEGLDLREIVGTPSTSLLSALKNDELDVLVAEGILAVNDQKGPARLYTLTSKGRGLSDALITPIRNEVDTRRLLLMEIARQIPHSEFIERIATVEDIELLRADIAWFLKDQLDEQTEEHLPSIEDRVDEIIELLNAQIEAISKTKKESQKEKLIKIISVFAVRIGMNIGPGSETLTQSETRAVWEAVNAFHKENSRIEVLLPQDIKLTDEMDSTLKDIRRREGVQTITTKPYDDNNLETLLAVKNSGVKRIIITTSASKPFVEQLATANPEIFRSERVLNIAMPGIYTGMDNTEKTVYQARLIMIAIMARLVEKDTPFIESVLKEMLRFHMASGADVDTFINRLSETDENAAPEEIKKTILYFLGTAVSLIERIGEELKFMREFWKSA